MKSILRVLLYSCKEATEKIEKREFQGLSILEKARLDKHLALCDACAVYDKFSIQMDKYLKGYAQTIKPFEKEIIETNDLKIRIIEKLSR